MTAPPLRVLVCTTVHVPEDARILHRQIAALLEAGHRVTYAAPWSDPDAGAPRPDRDRLAAADLPRSSGRRRLAGIRAARFLLARHGPSHDLVILHDPELLLAVAGRLRRLPPVVWDVHEDTAASLTDRPWVPGALRPAAAALARAAERWAERRLHLILAEEDYRRRFRREHPVVPNYPRLPPEPDPVPVEDRVVHVGRISRHRGAAELLEVARRLADDGITVELVGPADPEVAGAVRAAAEAGRVAWRGFLPNPDALARVPGAVAGLSLLHDEPNYRVSLPTKILEYLSRGTPVVTTPLPRARRIVEDHGAGTVVPFGDAAAAAAAVRQLRDRPEQRRAMAARGRAAVAAEYSWDVAGPRFVAQLERWAGS